MLKENIHSPLDMPDPLLQRAMKVNVSDKMYKKNMHNQVELFNKIVEKYQQLMR